ncbi:MAG TPA: Hpt domain-containing protein [Deferrisomatales bacterium]|nr:Hpt domain-containing protein [Deferrisomatales bacterium]
MSIEPVWPVSGTRSLSRCCAPLGGGGGSVRNPVWDDTQLLRTLRGNREAAARVARAFLDDHPQVAQRLRDAVRDGDRTRLQHLTHRLKGNAGILRAPAVRDAAEKLEKAAAGDDLAPAEQRLVVLEQCLAHLCEALGGFLASVEG